MWQAMEIIPEAELQRRWQCARDILADLVPGAEALIVFSRVHIYWFSGHFGNGLFWLPKQGDPVLLVRKGLERAKLDSPFITLYAFRSYSQVPALLQDLGQNLPGKVAAEKNGLSWNFAENLQSRLSGTEFVAGDQVIAQAKALKSEWELAKIRLAGQRHAQVMFELIPQKIRPGMTEWEISQEAWKLFYALGHQGLIRMSGPGEELYLGAISAGDSGNFPTVYNGPVGLRGVHPAVPQMGYQGRVWQKGQVLTVDTVFALEGYHTDKTSVYFAGPSSAVPDEVRRAQDLCLELEEWFKENVRTGVTPEEIYLYCVQRAKETGHEDGFMGLGGNKVPFVGHGIGLYVDEWPPLARRFKEPLAENMVLAFEPKVGLPGIGMVGLENTFLVTSQGACPLTGNRSDLICAW